MFLRRNRRQHNGECYGYWSLLRTVRTAKGPRHELVASLGKAPGLDKHQRLRWEHVGDLLEGRNPAPIHIQGQLGDPLPQPHPWMQVDVRALRVQRVRDFGEVYLALNCLRK